MDGIVQWLGDLLRMALRWFSDLFVAVFVAVWNVLTDLICWVVEKMLDLALSAVQGLDVSAITSQLSVLGDIPGEVMNVLSLLGVGQAIGIITAAIVIRFVLQLIPFVRLGS